MSFHNSLKYLFVCFTVYIGGCSPQIDIRGNFHDPEVLSQIKVGDITRLEVREILGTPSSITIFDQEKWLYISERTETVAFFEPVVKDRKIVILSFNKEGIVSKIEHLDEKNGKIIQPVSRTTVTSGNEYGFFQQLFGNVGRFNAPDVTGDAPGF